MAEYGEAHEGWSHPRIRHLRAEAAYGVNQGSDDILPRWVYEELGVDVPVGANDEWQRAPRKRRWWQRLRAS